MCASWLCLLSVSCMRVKSQAFKSWPIKPAKAVQDLWGGKRRIRSSFQCDTLTLNRSPSTNPSCMEYATLTSSNSHGGGASSLFRPCFWTISSTPRAIKSCPELIEAAADAFEFVGCYVRVACGLECATTSVRQVQYVGEYCARNNSTSCLSCHCIAALYRLLR